MRTGRSLLDTRLSDRRRGQAVRPTGEARREALRHLDAHAVWRLGDSGESGGRGDQARGHGEGRRGKEAGGWYRGAERDGLGRFEKLGGSVGYWGTLRSGFDQRSACLVGCTRPQGRRRDGGHFGHGDIFPAWTG